MRDDDFIVEGRVVSSGGGDLLIEFEMPDEAYDPFTGVSLLDEAFLKMMADLQENSLYTLADRLKRDNQTYSGISKMSGLSSDLIRSAYGMGGGDEADSEVVRRIISNRGDLNSSYKDSNIPPKITLQDTSTLRQIRNNNLDDRAEISSISEFKKRYGVLVNEKARELGVTPEILAAVIFVESSGSGFNNGKLLIRFENQWFVDRANGYGDLFTWDSKAMWKGHKYRESLDQAWKTVHTGYQKDEYAAFEFAKTLDEEAAYQSISMGMGQIMGFNYQYAGYNSAKEMFEHFSKGHGQQIRGMATFMKNYDEGKMLEALKNGDLTTFVSRYNGDGQIDEYTTRLRDAMEAYKNY